MSFLKENLFVTTLTAASVVVIAALLFSNCGSAGAVEAALEERKKLAETLGRLRNGPKANPAVNTKLEQRVETIQQEYRRIRRSLLNWNGARFPITQVPAEGGGTMPAFPCPAERQWRRVSLYVQQRYCDSLRELFDTLEFTGPPTQAELEEEVRAAQRALETELELRRREEAAAEEATGGRPGEVPVLPERNAPPTEPPWDETGARGIRRPDGGRREGLSSDLSQQAARRGRLTAIARRATAGRIYARAIRRRLITEFENSARDKRTIWFLRRKWCVLNDVLGAIRETNEQGLRARNAEPTVPNAPVKRFLDFQVPDGYHYAEPAAESSGHRQTGAESITRRATCTKYDVTHYQFTVVMPTRTIPALLRNLQRAGREFHIVRMYEVHPVGEGETTRGRRGFREGRAADADEDLYYYGTDPVREVTVYGEFLTLADGTRGLWEPQREGPNGKKVPAGWSKDFPPLMPVEVLQEIRTNDPDAVRPEDQRRLPKEAQEIPGRSRRPPREPGPEPRMPLVR